MTKVEMALKMYEVMAPVIPQGQRPENMIEIFEKCYASIDKIVSAKT